MVWILLQALAAWIQVVWRRKNERRHPVTTTIIVALEQLGQSGLGADSEAVLIEPVAYTQLGHKGKHDRKGFIA